MNLLGSQVVADIENIPLKAVNGTPVYIRNVATVHLGPDLRRGVAELDGVNVRHGQNG